MPLEKFRTYVQLAKLATTDTSTDINQSVLYPFESAPFLTAAFSYTAGNDYLTVNDAGTYEVHMSAGCTSGSSRQCPKAELYKNRTASGSGGTKLKTVGQQTYIRQAGSGDNTASWTFHWVGALAAGDTLAVQMSRTANSGATTLISGENVFYVKRID